jgi:FMN phosphatase YigB (HAD superfamily)
MRAARLLVLVLLALLVSACQVDAHVVVQMADDGSGAVSVVVNLDPEAAARVPDLAEQLQVDDLVAAGWEIDGPSTVEGGSVQLSASKPFATPEQGEQVLAELAGPDGVLQEIDLGRTHEFGRTTYSFEAAVDPSRGVASLADPALVELVGGEGFGGQLEQIAADTGASADEQVSLELEVLLPGASDAWAIEPGSDPQVLAVEHTELRPVPLALAAAAAVLALVGILLLLGRLVGVLRRRGRSSEVDDEPEDDEPAVPGRVVADEIAWGSIDGPGPDDVEVPPPPAVPSDLEPEGARRLQLVVLDVMGVVFPTGAATAELLATFVARRGSTVAPEAVASTYELAVEGRLTVGEVWASLGLTDDPGDLSDEFLALHRLRPGVREFLERMTARDLPVAGVANDVAEWSRKLRATHKLDHLTRAWLVSGDVGERLPGGAVLGRVIQVTGIEPRNALFISERVDYLDAARSYGFAGALYVPEDTEWDEADLAGVAYPIVRSFTDLAP